MKSKLKSLLFCGKLRKLVENQKAKPRQGRQIHKSIIALLLKHSKITPISYQIVTKDLELRFTTFKIKTSQNQSIKLNCY